MGQDSKIEWTDHTFNPWWGCMHVHEGCRHCYAETFAKRFGVKWGPSGVRRVASEQQWKQPLKWNLAAEKAGVRAKVFCASMADVFEEWDGQVIHSTGIPMWIEREQYRMDNHPFGWGAGVVCDEPHKYLPLNLGHVRERLFRLIDSTPNLDWQLLTKRPENIRRMWPNAVSLLSEIPMGVDGNKYRPNVQLGTSISDQASADKQIPELLKCRDLSPVLFLSTEPLLGSIRLDQVQHDGIVEINSLNGDHGVHRPLRGRSESKIDWVIVGGESGPGARPMHPDWVRSLRNQCIETETPFFFKQWGEFVAPDQVCGGMPITAVANAVALMPDGRKLDRKELIPKDQGVAVLLPAGKSDIGRLLDGRPWSQFPNEPYDRTKW